MIIYDTKLTMIQIYPYYREYAKNVQTCNVFQNNIEISPNKKLIHNKNKVHNNTTISENQSTIQVLIHYTPTIWYQPYRSHNITEIPTDLVAILIVAKIIQYSSVTMYSHLLSSVDNMAKLPAHHHKNI